MGPTYKVSVEDMVNRNNKMMRLNSSDDQG